MRTECPLEKNNYIDHQEPDGSITRWYEHQCFPFMGIHWLPMEPNLGDADVCGELDWDQALYSPTTLSLIGFSFYQPAKVTPYDSIGNIYLDYSGGTGTAYENLGLVWFPPTCLEKVEVSNTHVFLGTENMVMEACEEPTKCSSKVNCLCQDEDGNPDYFSKCYCATDDAKSCAELNP